MKLQLMPIICVSNVEKSIEFYANLGFTTRTSSRLWTELENSESVFPTYINAELENGESVFELQLDSARASRIHSGMMISFNTDEKLENIKTQLETADIETQGIVDEAFGRSMSFQDPDGLVIRINEHDLELPS